MATVSLDNQMPGWTIHAACVLIMLMAAGMACSIMRDIIQMQAMWRSAAAYKERKAEKKRRELEKERHDIEARILSQVKPPEADCAGAKKRHGVDLRETDLRLFTSEGNRNDHHAGIPEDHVQGEGYQDAVPCRSEG